MILLFLESPNLLPWSVARAKVDRKPGRSACSGALSLATRTKQENPYLYTVSLTASQTLIQLSALPKADLLLGNMQHIWGAPHRNTRQSSWAVHHLMLCIWSKLIIPASFLGKVFSFRINSLCWCSFGSMSLTAPIPVFELITGIQSLECKQVKMCKFCWVFQNFGALSKINLQYLNLCIPKLLYSQPENIWNKDCRT